MSWDRLNTWTHTLYTLVHSLNLAKEKSFSGLDKADDSLKEILQKLVGRLQVAGQIDPRFKQRAKTLNEGLADRL